MSSKTVAGLVVGICITVLVFSFYNHFSNRSGNSNASVFSSSIMSSRSNELSNPANYLSYEVIDLKIRLLKRTKIEGRLYNHAKHTTYRDVVLRLDWLDGDGVALKSREAVIDEIISPGGNAKFAIFQNPPLNTESYRITIMRADAN